MLKQMGNNINNFTLKKCFYLELCTSHKSVIMDESGSCIPRNRTNGHCNDIEMSKPIKMTDKIVVVLCSYLK